MNLQQTVSEILEREVTEQEAMEFARDQFGVLNTFIREQYVPKVVVSMVNRDIVNEVFTLKKQL